MARNEINVQGELAHKTGNGTVEKKREFQKKTNNGDCAIIRYPRVV